MDATEALHLIHPELFRQFTGLVAAQTTRKGGVIKFSEVKKFTVIGENSPAASQPNDITFSLSSETA